MAIMGTDTTITAGMTTTRTVVTLIINDRLSGVVRVDCLVRLDPRRT